MSSVEPFEQAVQKLRRLAPEGADLALVLGSGLGEAAGMLRNDTELSVAALPDYPVTGVEGHAGTIGFATVSGLRLMVFRGRIHLYERGSIQDVLAPIAVAHALRARILLLTNAAGGIRQSFQPGDLMLIEDQMDFTFRSVLAAELRGSRRQSHVYDPGLLRLSLDVARRLGLPLHQGVYAGVLGPTYETAAEIGMLSRAGADAVGMSTVLEAKEAVRRGMKVLGLSLITNRATGTGETPTCHEEVTAVGAQASERVARLIGAIVQALATGEEMQGPGLD